MVLWLGSSHIQGGTFVEWLYNPLLPSYGQQITDVANNSVLDPIRTMSGLFHLWYGQGITSLYQLDSITLSCVLIFLVTIVGGFYHFHGSSSMAKVSSSLSHLTSVVTLGSIAWSSHLFHVAIPVVMYLSFGCTSAADLPGRHTPLSYSTVGSHIGLEVVYYPLDSHFHDSLVLSSGHHYGLAVFGLVLSLGSVWSLNMISLFIQFGTILQPTLCWDIVLFIQLGLVGMFSILYSHLSYSFPSYPYLSSDIAVLTSLFIHHMWIGTFLNVGSFTHLAIGIVRDEGHKTLLQDLLQHRDMLVGHTV